MVFDTVQVSTLHCLHNNLTFVDTYFIVQFVVIDSSGTLCFMWIQYLTYPILLLWNLSSAYIDLVIFIFLPLNSFFNMFAELMNLFLSPSSLKWMNACVIGFVGHSILALPMFIPTSFIDSFKSCETSDSDVSLWNPVTTALPQF